MVRLYGEGPAALRTARCAAFLAAGLMLVVGAGCGGSDPAVSGDGNGPAATPTPSSVQACGEGAPVEGTPDLDLARIAGGFDGPVDLQSPPDDCRLFVVEKPGRIRIIDGAQVLDPPFLDVSDRVGASGGEQGLLGLAFHPRYADNGRFFVNYTDRNGDTRIAEYRAGPGEAQADPDSERVVLRVAQPYSNHNGGGLAFGNDGYLYAGLGDGGSGGDPQGHGQNLGTLLGAMLRLDVDGGMPYAIPADNPFVGRAGARDEIWAYGLRNPWRFAFDRGTGDLLIADVGQSEMEEIDLGRAATGGGENYGWNVMEGSRCYEPATGCDRAGLTLPIVTYTHAEGCSITGGAVYRGRRMPGYHGTYFYSDYCTGFLRSLRLDGARAVDRRDWTATLGASLERVTSFGVDGDGEIHVVTQNGDIHRIVPAG